MLYPEKILKIQVWYFCIHLFHFKHQFWYSTNLLYCLVICIALPCFSIPLNLVCGIFVLFAVLLLATISYTTGECFPCKYHSSTKHLPSCLWACTFNAVSVRCSIQNYLVSSEASYLHHVTASLHLLHISM